MQEYSMRVYARFLRHVKIDKTSGCWLWRGSLDADNYGRFWFDGRNYKAARLSFVFFNHSAIPFGYDVHHTCYRRPCVNPRCLVPLTREEHLELEGQHWFDCAGKVRFLRHMRRG